MTQSLGVAKPHKRRNFIKIKNAQISEKFKFIYEQVLEQYAGDLEQKRKRLIKSIIVCLVLFAIAITIALYLKIIIRMNFGRKNWEMVFIFIIPSLYFIYKYRVYNKIYVESFKNKIIKNFVKYIDHNLNYNQYGGEELLNSYLDAEFEDKNFNNFATDDYIEGYNKDDIYIEMCNFSLENVNNNNEFLNLIDEGIFSNTKINKYLPYEIRIKNNELIVESKNNKVQMDNKEFEKYFSVYCKSNILVMEILTHDVMEEIINFYEKYNIKFEIVIKNNNIYVRFNTGVMFEPNIFKKSNDINTLWIYYNVLLFVTGITAIINEILADLEI